MSLWFDAVWKVLAPQLLHEPAAEPEAPLKYFPWPHVVVAAHEVARWLALLWNVWTPQFEHVRLPSSSGVNVTRATASMAVRPETVLSLLHFHEALSQSQSQECSLKFSASCIVLEAAVAVRPSVTCDLQS